MKAKVTELDIPEGRRIIAVSDIHGKVDCFKRLLDKAEFSDRDILIIVGDLVEKGPDNLGALRLVMDMCRGGNVYALCGNCDYATVKFIRSDIRDSEFLEYVLSRKTLVGDMCRELSIPLVEQSDIRYIKAQIELHFKEELDWLEGLPTIIDTPNFTFVHAGLSQGGLNEQQHKTCIKNDYFVKQGLSFDKYVIVGHMPTINYCVDKPCCNPMVDAARRIISIDGGNVIKRFGQLNAFIISSAEDFSFVYCDDLLSATAVESRNGIRGTITTTWYESEITVLEKGREFSYCQHIATGIRLNVANDRIYERDGRMHCYDATDHWLSVCAGEDVSLIDEYSDRYLAKKDGIVGWVDKTALTPAKEKGDNNGNVKQ